MTRLRLLVELSRATKAAYDAATNPGERDQLEMIGGHVAKLIGECVIGDELRDDEAARMERRMLVKLYEIPNDSKIYEPCSDGSTFFIFHRIDGSYSTCTTEKGALVHLGASCPLATFEDGYKFDRSEAA